MSKHVLEAKTPNQCDWCSKAIIYPHRVYKNEKYCANCYRTWFIHKPCHKCGTIHRLHKKEEFSICLPCQRKQPCFRCGADALKNGSTTQYGRVCRYCYRHYFKPLKTCFECGKQKIGLTKCQFSHHKEEICQTCYQKYTHATCVCCHRYRAVIHTPDGQKCKKCHDIGQKPCPICKNTMWAGVGTYCWDCYGKESLHQKINFSQNLFHSKQIKIAYKAFLIWLANARSTLVANQKYGNFIDFFIHCDEVWGNIPEYDLLVIEYKPEGLRHNLSVLRWLIDTQQITVNRTLKEQIAEQDRIDKLLAKLGDNTPQIIENYHTYLSNKQQQRKTALKSIRLNLQPVVDIYQQFDLKGENTPSQAQIDQYLSVKRGQANCLSAFIVFLRQTYDIHLTGKPSEIIISNTIDRKVVEKQILQLAQLPKPLSKTDNFKWLQLSMIYFHKQPLNIPTIKKLEVTEDINNGMTLIHYKEQVYPIPRF